MMAKLKVKMDSPLLVSIFDLKNNLIDFDKLQVEGVIPGMLDAGVNPDHCVPRTIAHVFAKLRKAFFNIKVGHLPKSDVWYALVNNKVAWSNGPITIAPYDPLELDSYEEEQKEEVTPKFNRYTALLEDKE